jgi:hypothetical protein
MILSLLKKKSNVGGESTVGERSEATEERQFYNKGS